MNFLHSVENLWRLLRSLGKFEENFDVVTKDVVGHQIVARVISARARDFSGQFIVFLSEDVRVRGKDKQGAYVLLSQE